MDTLTISLPDSLKQFVNEQISTGAYGSASEYLRQLISDDQERKEREDIERQILEGLDSGPAVPFGPEEFEEIRAQVRARSRQRESNEKCD
jgi:antitoxin ParD1/3/4